MTPSRFRSILRKFVIGEDRLDGALLERREAEKKTMRGGLTVETTCQRFKKSSGALRAATRSDIHEPRPVGGRSLVSGMFLLAAFLVAAFVPATAEAQWGGFGRMGGYASTAQQGAAYGMAQVIRSQGYANLQNSEAAKNWEDAKSMEIDNREKWTNTYFDMRKTNREARAEERGPPITQEQAIRLAHKRAPTRLTTTQLDPVTGHITYPLVLTDTEFDPYRENVDRLFAERASSGGSVSYDQFQEIQQAVNSFADALKERVDRYAAGDYGTARTFLTSLAHEARFPGS